MDAAAAAGEYGRAAGLQAAYQRLEALEVQIGAKRAQEERAAAARDYVAAEAAQSERASLQKERTIAEVEARQIGSTPCSEPRRDA
eukprot:64582-Prymnesium_polylepis.1